jgi:hypothetical protein
MKPVEKILGGSRKALCPAHDDREPSHSVSDGDDGRTLVKCFAGCEATEIAAELGLEMGDPFERRNGHRKIFRSTPRKRHSVRGKDIPHSCSAERRRLSPMPEREVPDEFLA